MNPQRRHYLATLLPLAAPIMVQQFFIAALGLVDTLLVGQLGDTEVAAVALAGQVLFLVTLLYFGMSTGSGIFIAQYWGRENVDGIRKVFGLNLLLNLAIGLVFTALGQLFPDRILALFTRDLQVIALGSRFLRVASLGYAFVGVSQAAYIMLRSTERVRVPMTVGSLALSLSTLLGYLLIFGRLGLPKMGIQGAATAFVVSRVLELGIVGTLVLFRYPYNLLRPLFRFDADLLKRYMQTAMPVVFNELFWAGGVLVYNAVYAHISTDSVTATSIAGTIENVAFVPFLGVGHATAILVGKKIGARKVEEAFQDGRRILILVAAMTVVICSAILLSKGWILELYRISDSARANANLVLTFVCLAVFFKAANFSLIVGVMRAGGDTRFTLAMEFSTIWLWGVPAALLTATVLHWPVYYVALAVYTEEVVKFILGFTRFRSRKWVHDLAAAL